MEEDFLSLLEEHLSDEAFEEFGDEKIEVEDEEKVLKSSKLEYKKEDMMSISHFIKSYLGFKAYEETKIDMPALKGEVETESFKLDDKHQLTEVVDKYEFYHSGLKDMNIPYVIGVSHDYANKHPEYVYQGFLLLVIDAKGHPGTYLNPIMICEYVNRNKTFAEFRELCEQENDIEPGSYKCTYLRLKEKVDAINTMHMILYETHKLRQVNKIEEDEKERGLK